MHPVMTDQIAEIRIAELRREAAKWQWLHELRSNGGPTATRRRGWLRSRAARRRFRPAAA